jgi:hypothetical protein
MSIDSDPQAIQGTKINAGRMVMGKLNDGSRNSFDIETCPDIDRKIQA